MRSSHCGCEKIPILVNGHAFPLPLSAYADPPGSGLLDLLWSRIEAEPFNAVATGIFLLAVVHTFVAPRFTEAAHRRQARMDGGSAVPTGRRGSAMGLPAARARGKTPAQCGSS